MASRFLKVRTFTTAEPRLSFCVYGTKPDYVVGAINNAVIAQRIYPGWLPRFYIDPATQLFTSLVELGCEVCVMSPAYVKDGPHPMSWRMLALVDTAVQTVVFRDADSLLNLREAAAVKEWRAGAAGCHRMKEQDHIPCPPLLGGMWGVRDAAPFRPWVGSAIELSDWCAHTLSYPGDYPFLTKYIWPQVRQDCLYHGVADDEYGKAREFPPHPPIPCGFVGARFRDGEWGFK